MSDDGNSGGSLGAIISTLLLVAIWPYLMALLGIYIAYMLAIAILEWLVANWMISLAFLAGSLMIYITIRERLIQKWFQRLRDPRNPKCTQRLAGGVPTRTFIPSSNLYCYWCTKKLGLQAYEYQGKYYCDACYEKLNLS